MRKSSASVGEAARKVSDACQLNSESLEVNSSDEEGELVDGDKGEQGSGEEEDN